jgi:hypothetical protein
MWLDPAEIPSFYMHAYVYMLFALAKNAIMYLHCFCFCQEIYTLHANFYLYV